MYVHTLGPEGCDNVVYGVLRDPATLTLPPAMSLGEQLWSFDDMTTARAGQFLQVTCDWGAP